MSAFNELILIPKNEYEKFNLKEQNNIESELKDIKKNTEKLNSHQKHVIYKEKLGKFLSSSKNMREPIKINVSKEYKPLLNTPSEEDLIVQRLKKIPKDYRSKIFTIYNKLRALPGVKEAEKTVTIDGKRLKYSLFDYVSEGVQPSTIRRPLLGYPHAVKLMFKGKIHKSSIANRSYQKRLQMFRDKENNLDDTLVGSGTPVDFKKWINFRF